MIVVPVFITSCHVSLKPNKGPVRAHAIITATAIANVMGRPVAMAARRANFVNNETLKLLWLGLSSIYDIMRSERSR